MTDRGPSDWQRKRMLELRDGGETHAAIARHLGLACHVVKATLGRIDRELARSEAA